jgi:uncharacterized protein (TIRG00374 family)
MTLRQLMIGATKTAVCVAAIAWVARGVDFGGWGAVWLDADKSLLAAAVLLFFATPVLQGVRLRRLLAGQGISLGAAESVQLAFAGNFMNFAAPIGSTSGDVYKAIYLGRREQQGWEAATVTFLDRAVGLGTLLLSVTAIALLSGADSRLSPLRGYLTVLSLGMLAAIAATLWLTAPGADRLGAWLARAPKRATLERIAHATRALFSRPGVLALAVVDTVGIQIAAAGSFLCLALALGFAINPDDLLAVYAFFSSGEIVKALPGPPQGLGTMEVAYSFFFADWAGPTQIVSAALAIRAVNLICSLPGAAFVVGWKPGASSPAIQPVGPGGTPRRATEAAGAPAAPAAAVP